MTALATSIYAVLTAALVCIASRQVRALIAQSAAAQKAAEQQLAAIEAEIRSSSEASAHQLAEMERARINSLRPVVFVKSAWLLNYHTGTAIRAPLIEIENIGPGPVLRIDVSVWTFADEGREYWEIVEDAPLLAQQIQTNRPMATVSILAPGRPGAAIHTLLQPRKGESTR